MAPKPEPLEEGEERRRWFAEADAETRAAHPRYCCQTYDAAPWFFWNELEVSEVEFHAHAQMIDLDRKFVAEVLIKCADFWWREYDSRRTYESDR